MATKSIWYFRIIISDQHLTESDPENMPTNELIV